MRQSEARRLACIVDRISEGFFPPDDPDSRKDLREIGRLIAGGWLTIVLRWADAPDGSCVGVKGGTHLRCVRFDMPPDRYDRITDPSGKTIPGTAELPVRKVLERPVAEYIGVCWICGEDRLEIRRLDLDAEGVGHINACTTCRTALAFTAISLKTAVNAAAGRRTGDQD